jgi:hypothetical protein
MQIEIVAQLRNEIVSPKRGITDDLPSGRKKTHRCAVAVRGSRRLNCGVKTNRILATIFVLEKTRKRNQRVNAFLKAGGRESKAEVVPTTDLLMQTPLSHEG